MVKGIFIKTQTSGVINLGKFDGILFCTDLDDTLLTTDKRISDENKQAIEYFMSEGGLFTFATGRVVDGARLMLDRIRPNAPMICFNGAGIYDFSAEKMLSLISLDSDAIRAVEFIYNRFPFAAVDICTASESCFCRTNAILEQHKHIENLKDNYIDYHDVTDPWIKVIFMTEENQVDIIKTAFAESEFADKYSFVRSSPWYYELLPKNSDKGQGLIKLAELLNIPIERTIAMGDNENDISLVRNAGVGVAVANAAQSVKQAANCITVDNNSDAVKAIITALNKGMLL